MDRVEGHRTDLIFFICFLLITSFGLLFRNVLNYSNEFRFIADSLGNIGGVIVASFLFFWWANESRLKGREFIILCVGIGLIIYEFLQILIPWQTFDIKDIWGTFIGVIITSLLNILIFVLRKINRELKQ